MRNRVPHIILVSTAFCATLSLMAFDAPARQDRDTQSVVRGIDSLRPWQHSNGTIEHRGAFFKSWEAWRLAQGSDFDYRCGTPSVPIADPGGVAGFAGSDCDLERTVPAEQYDPSNGDLVIPVVVHVIQNDDATLGWIDRATIENQIRILNDDFSGVGISSTDDTAASGIRLALAGIDPDGGSTIGITWSQNSVWFNDQGEYWNSLAWDPTRYLNIYTNTASGNFGYVNQLPAAGFAGEAPDRVVVDWRVFGEGGEYGSPQDLGRILTHETGHYLGLFHTFQDGCDGADCSMSGDRICDTSSQASPNLECASADSCGTVEPVSNFMNYSWQVCMSEFTPEQVRRMRCTIQIYRPELSRKAAQCAYTCECDLNRDGKVDGSDIGLMLGKMGPTKGDLISCGDFNLDGVIDGNDFGKILVSWGDCVPEPCEGIDNCNDDDDCTIDYCAAGECVNLAIPFCGICGDPAAGSCYESNGSVGCSEMDCCEAICNFDPYCCQFTWDASCKNKALSGNFPECDG